MAEQPEWLRALPGRCRVRREALVEDSERHRERRIAQVGVEGLELVRGAERLVRDRAERERGDVRARLLLYTPACAIGTSFRLVERDTEWLEQDQLLFPYTTLFRPPAAKPEPLGHAGLLDRGAGRFVSKEDHCKTAPGPGNQSAGEWEEETCAVTGQPIGADRAAMAHSCQPFEQPVDDRARSTAARIGEEADAAGVTFAAEVVG